MLSSETVHAQYSQYSFEKTKSAKKSCIPVFRTNILTTPDNNSSEVCTVSKNKKFEYKKFECKKDYSRVVKITGIRTKQMFTPLVFSAYGGCSRETKQAIATLADRLAEKKDTKISTVTNWIRTKISFALLRSSLLCIRGSRAVYQKPDFITEDILSENNSRL